MHVCGKHPASSSAQLKPPSLAGLKSQIPKLSETGTAFYEHLEFGYKWLRRFDSKDVESLSEKALQTDVPHSESKTRRPRATRVWASALASPRAERAAYGVAYQRSKGSISLKICIVAVT